MLTKDSDRNFYSKFEEIFNKDSDIETIQGLEEASKLKIDTSRSIWGISPNSPLHFGYDKLLSGQIKLLDVGLEHNIVIADLHSVLITHNFNVNNIQKKADYYYACLKDLMGLKKARFHFGSSFQLENQYTDLLYKAIEKTSLAEAEQAIPDLKTLYLSDLIQPLMQAIDTVYLDCNIAIGDTGQLRVYSFARKLLSKLGYEKPVTLISKLGLDIEGNQLKKSRTNTRISIHESNDSLIEKIEAIYSPRVREGNPLLDLFEYSVFPYLKDDDRKVKTSGFTRIKIENIEHLKLLYEDGYVSASFLKSLSKEVLWDRIRDFNNYFESNPSLINWIDLKKIRGQ